MVFTKIVTLTSCRARCRPWGFWGCWSRKRYHRWLISSLFWINFSWVVSTSGARPSAKPSFCQLARSPAKLRFGRARAPLGLPAAFLGPSGPDFRVLRAWTDNSWQLKIPTRALFSIFLFYATWRATKIGFIRQGIKKKIGLVLLLFVPDGRDVTIFNRDSSPPFYFE